MPTLIQTSKWDTARQYITSLQPILWVDLSKRDAVQFPSDDSSGLALTSFALPKTGPQGKTFVASSLQYIYRSTPDWQIGDTQGTIMAWFKTTSVSRLTLFASGDEATNTSFFEFDIGGSVAGLIEINQRDNAGVTNEIYGTTPLNNGNWHLGTLQSNGSAYSIFADATLQTLTANAGSNTGAWLGNTTLRDNISIGAIVRNITAGYFDGMIGMVLYFNRALMPQTIQHIWELTKWRYQ